jgi:hypothetical protein
VKLDWRLRDFAGFSHSAPAQRKFNLARCGHDGARGALSGCAAGAVPEDLGTTSSPAMAACAATARAAFAVNKLIAFNTEIGTSFPSRSSSLSVLRSMSIWVLRRGLDPGLDNPRETSARIQSLVDNGVLEGRHSTVRARAFARMSNGRSGTSPGASTSALRENSPAEQRAEVEQGRTGTCSASWRASSYFAASITAAAASSIIASVSSAYIGSR